MKMKGFRRLISVVSFALLVASIIQELRKSPTERTWHGTVAGVFPYELRIPTVERARATFWNPDNPHVLVPTLFGVGWSLNVGALVQPRRFA